MNKIFNIKLSLFVFCLFNSLSVFSAATLSTNCYYNGYWGDWKNYWTECWGNYGGFKLYNYGEHISNYHFAFNINGYTTPSKKEIKEHRKNKTWWTYTGTVEYYISDVYPTLKSALMELGRPLEEKDADDFDYKYKKLPLARAANMSKNGKTIGFTRIIAKATIKIAPYKKHPDTYNIWVDDVALGISLNGQSFNIK